MRKREVESCREMERVARRDMAAMRERGRDEEERGMERAAREGTGGVDFEIERWKGQIS